MGSNHMHDSMRESEKERYNEINYLNTTRKVVSDKDRDMKSVIKRVKEIASENTENGPKQTSKGSFIGDKTYDDIKPAIDKMVKMSSIQPIKTNEYLLTIKELDIPNWCYQKVLRPNKTKSGWSEMSVNILNIINEDVSKKLSPLFNTNWFTKNRLNLKLEILEPSGSVIETWEYKCEIIGYEYSPLSYGDDNLDVTKLRLQPKTVKLIS